MPEETKPRKKVMVIDDEPAVVDQISLLLSESDFRPICVTSALEAMSLLSSEQPDLVVLDIRMPRLDGFEFLRSLRQSLRTKNLPVIIVSALSDGECRLRAKEMGVVRYLVKPYKPDELVQLIRSLVGE